MEKTREELEERLMTPSLMWSDQSYLLEKFLQEYTLPQVIRVVQGHDSGTDITSLSHDEVLILHGLTKARILAGEDGHGHAIAIRLDSPHKLQLLPLLGDCQYRSCGIEELSSVFPKVKYVQVLQGHQDRNNDSDSTSNGEIFEVLNVDKRNKRAKVKVLATGRTQMMSFKCEAVFTPVLDGKAGYFAKDLESHFDLPVRVRLLKIKDEAANLEGTEEDDPSGLLPGNVDVTIVEETEDILVVATTAGENVRCKFCYEIPRDLQVTVQTVAQSFREQNGDYYQNLVAKFDQLSASNFPKSGYFTRRGTIIGHRYETIEKLFNSRPEGNAGTGRVEGNSSPALPPRNYQPARSKCTSLSSKLNWSKRNRSVKEKEKLKPSNHLKPRSASAPVDPDNLKMRPRMSPKLPPRIRFVPKEPSSVNNELLNNSVSSITTSKAVPGSLPGVLNLSEGEELLGTKHLAPTSEDTDGSPSIPNVPGSSHKHGALKPGSIPTSHLSELPRKDPGGSQSVPLSTSERSHLCLPQVSNRQPGVSPKLPRRPPSIHTKPIRSSTVIDKKNTPSPSKVHFSNESDGCSDILPKLPLRQHSIRVSPVGSPTNTHEHSDTRPSKQRLLEETESNSDYLVPLDIFDSQTNRPPLESRIKNCPAVIDNELGEDIYEEVKYLGHRNGGSSGSGGDMEGPYVNISKVPSDLSCLTVKKVSQLLRDLNMGCYVVTFEEELIDGGLLGKLNKDDLESLNVKSFHITKLLEFIRGWRPKQHYSNM